MFKSCYPDMELFFYIWSSFILTCTTLVIGIANPIHSILLLIIVFSSGSLLLFMLNLEFFGIIFLIVYVGAIAVLFLFVVMMLDIKVINTAQKMQDFFSYKGIIAYFLLLLLLSLINEDVISFIEFIRLEGVDGLIDFVNYALVLKPQSPLQILGTVLYKDYIIQFLLCGFILFIAMVGAIVVTLEDNELKSVKQQNPVAQTFRNSENSIFNFKTYKRAIKK